MKKILKISVWVFSAIAVLAVLSVCIYSYLASSQHSKSKETETLKIKEASSPAGGKIIEVAEKDKPDVEIEFPMDMDEFDIQEAIHNQTHQKVIAEDKWGFLPLTQDRVKRLIKVVEHNGGKYQNSELYKQILNRWLNNNFTEIDKDHNAIWSLQDGTIGEATGIMSAEEERSFIETYYEIEE